MAYQNYKILWSHTINSMITSLKNIFVNICIFYKIDYMYILPNMYFYLCDKIMVLYFLPCAFLCLSKYV